jgi:hypothetical protein
MLPLLGPDRYPYLEINLSDFHVPALRKLAIICFVDTLPQEIDLTRRAMGFINEDVDPIHQIGYLVAYESLPNATDFTFYAEDRATRYSDRSDKVSVGGQSFAIWSDLLSIEARDFDLNWIAVLIGLAISLLADVYAVWWRFRTYEDPS